ncbi:MAG: site-specific integrase [Desulfobacteraceae bacterium]|nr:site-specific integrase [Desulfobacteraceae bacterium]MBC2750844.1 site-specific integrase [Desulfobacteraceae bacterium]
MTLESISIEGLKPQAVPHQGQYPSATVSPEHHPSDTLPALQNFLRRMDEAGLSNKGYTLHALRHTFASELLNAGMRLECLQQLLGHSSIEMTRRYARLTDNTRREEYFKAMQIIESGGVHGHYRRHSPLPQIS